jgi:inosine-uridine nucleoside N-ribohydrolase
MPRKLVIVADPGIDGAFAIALALHDPELDLLGIAASPGNVDANQATQNVHIIIEQIDPRRWPRIGEAPPVEYGVDARRLHGPNGLGHVTFPCARLHHPHPSDKLLVDLVRQDPKQVTVAVLGPLTVLARALDRDPELPNLVQRIVCVGGTWHEPGNATAAAEFHFYCDPAAARQVLRCGAPITLIPLDVSRKIVYSPRDMMETPAPESRTVRFLNQIIPFGIGTTSNQYGVEGFHLKDVVGIAAVSMPGSITSKPMPVDVELRGEITRGMSVVDHRPLPESVPNVDLATDVDSAAVRAYIDRTLRSTV